MEIENWISCLRLEFNLFRELLLLLLLLVRLNTISRSRPVIVTSNCRRINSKISQIKTTLKLRHVYRTKQQRQLGNQEIKVFLAPCASVNINVQRRLEMSWLGWWWLWWCVELGEACCVPSTGRPPIAPHGMDTVILLSSSPGEIILVAVRGNGHGDSRPPVVHLFTFFIE